MSTRTAIQWTDVTDNIIVAEQGGWWCRMISEGCVNCYAAKLNQSDYFGGNHLPYTGQPPKLKLRTDLIDGWERQRNSKKHFVASMTDVFGEWVPWAWQLNFLRGMWRAPKQTFQILTKRADIMRTAIAKWLDYDGLKRVPDNIWPGTSVENLRRGQERIPHLLMIPAKTLWISAEPLLSNLDLTRCGPETQTPLTATYMGMPHQHTARINWVVVGGESGPNARPCNIDWVRGIKHQCKCAGVPCFVKQLGSKPVLSTQFGHDAVKDVPIQNIIHSKGGNIAEWPEDLRVREFPV